MIPIPTPLVEFMLLGPVDDRRQLQDSPILGDVWVQFGKEPAKEADVLISPYRGQHAGMVAEKIDKGLPEERDAEISFLQGLIVAKLTFREVAELVVPKTKWWLQRWQQVEVMPGFLSLFFIEKKKLEIHEFQKNYKRAKVEAVVNALLESAREWHKKTQSLKSQELPALDRFVALTGLLLWAADHTPASPQPDTLSAAEQISYILDHAEPAGIADLLMALGGNMLKDPVRKPYVWSVSLNRPPLPALSKSIPAVKADAAHTLFKVDCSEIGWAVIDSGIDGKHPAFGDRVKRSFDFKNYRKIVNLSNLKTSLRQKNLAELQADTTWANLKEKPDKPEEYLQRLAEDACNRGPIHWELVERFVEIDPRTKPSTSHGTHVAGIIGASKKKAVEHAGKERSDLADGMCPDIQLYDFRVLGKDMKDAEFAIIAALQFIRYLNDRDNFLTIHGANLSLSIPHDVRNFACGRTPICNECEHLIESGVVVVTAAGNHGYKSFETKEGAYDSYAAFSITDPGNADGVITVGATHRYWPHTYGVSFFSSRGPTGDGRLKPDLVAPGERIRAPFVRSGDDHPPGGEWNDLDGTSMAAPHVSGAAAMLMGRYSELIGQPRRIKQILCDSATDLGRERSFQGRGMLDVLRAFQSI